MSLESHWENTCSKTWNFAGLLENDKDHFMNAVLGIAGEAGEIADLHKKIHFHGLGGDNYHGKHTAEEIRRKMLLEFGDLYYYFSVASHLWGFTQEEIEQSNQEKLFARHARTVAREAANVGNE